MDNMGYNLSHKIFWKKVNYVKISEHSNHAESAWMFVSMMMDLELIWVSNKAAVASNELETVGCFWGQY